MTTHYYGFLKRFGLYHAVVFHWSFLDKEKVYDYLSSETYEYSSQAIDAAKEWADNKGLEVEMEP